MREPKPFFRNQTQSWYVQIGKKQHNLGPDEQVAKQKYHALMAGRQPVTEETTVYAVLFQFLGWNKQHREGSTHEFYKRHIVSFAEYIGETLRVEELKPFHITNWLDQCYPKTRKVDGKTVPGASDNYRRASFCGGSCSAYENRAFNSEATISATNAPSFNGPHTASTFCLAIRCDNSTAKGRTSAGRRHSNSRSSHRSP
jgi:hypothetical protein